MLSFVVGALVLGGAIGPAAVLAADPPPTTGSRLVIAPFMDTRSMPNRSLAKDAHGVVMAAYGGTLGNQYNPVTISHRWYAKVTGDPLFAGYADRFQRYLDACIAASNCPG